MSKRAATMDLALRPIKLTKGANVWRIIPDEDDVKSKEFKPVEGGPKTRIFKSCVLNYKPRIDVFVSLEGFYPEVRFSGPNGTFTMTGDEFLGMSDTQTAPGPADHVRLEPVTEAEAEGEEGYRLVRYDQTRLGMNDLYPSAVFDLNKYASKRLKEKLSVLRDHVCTLKANEAVIRVMFDCVVDVYEHEYALLHSSLPIHDRFSELSRIVELYVPPVMIVRAFLEKLQEQKLVSTFNHYGLLSAILPQKSTLFCLCL